MKEFCRFFLNVEFQPFFKQINLLSSHPQVNLKNNIKNEQLSCPSLYGC